MARPQAVVVQHATFRAMGGRRGHLGIVRVDVDDVAALLGVRMLRSVRMVVTFVGVLAASLVIVTFAGMVPVVLPACVDEAGVRTENVRCNVKVRSARCALRRQKQRLQRDAREQSERRDVRCPGAPAAGAEAS